MQFSLRSLIAATTYFGLSAAAVGAWVSCEQASLAARAQGRPMCGNYQFGLTVAVMLLAIAGVLSLKGRGRTAAILAILGVLLFLAE